MYIVCKRFNNTGIDKPFNLPVDTECEVINNVICSGDKRICYITSQNAYDYFANNDDGKGKQRFTLSHNILDEIKRIVREDNEAMYNLIKDCETEEEREEALAGFTPRTVDIEINFNFYNKPVNELQSIYDRVKVM